MRVKDELLHLKVKPNKTKGQNFVIQPFVIDDLLVFGRPLPNEQLIEIGPGLGALTEALPQEPPLILIEIEQHFAENLKLKFPNANVINDDIRNVDFATFGKKVTVFGNLPYSFSNDIIFHLHENRNYIKRCILLFQKEFSERLTALPRTKAYGMLTVLTKAIAETRLGPIFSGSCFHPPTKVESQVVEVVYRDKFLVNPNLWGKFEFIVRLAFTQRRKKLHNTFRTSRVFSDDELSVLFDSISVLPGQRAEELDVIQFIELATQWEKINPSYNG
jgi:16S rRNA (adenine1518-N6/adenine1519-N6)-dimethyltransferase